MSDKLDSKPEQRLAGIWIAITRAAHQAQKQRTLLEAHGAQVVHYPTIDIVPPRNWAPLDAALRNAARGAFDWLILTSTNTVEMVAERLRELEIEPAALSSLQIAAVGSATAQIIQEQLQRSVDLTPDQYTAENLADALHVDDSTRLLLPQSAVAKSTLANTLCAAGADVTVVEAYRNVIARGGDDVPVMLWEGRIDAITFTSESTVRFFAKRLKFEGGTLAMLDDVVVACIGPVTARAARRFGLKVAVVPEEHTLEGLTEALAEYFEERA